MDDEKKALEIEVARLEEVVRRAEARAREAEEAMEESAEGEKELRESMEFAVREVKRLEGEGQVQAGVNRGLSKRLAEAEADLRWRCDEAKEAMRRCEEAEREVMRLEEGAKGARGLMEETGRRAEEAVGRSRRLEGMVEELEREVMRLNREHEDEIARLRVSEEDLRSDNGVLQREVMRLEEGARDGSAGEDGRVIALTRALEDCEEKLKESEGGRAELRRGIGRMEHEIEGLGEELERARGEKGEVERELERARGEKGEVERELERAKEAAHAANECSEAAERARREAEVLAEAAQGGLERAIVEKEAVEGEVDELKRWCARLEVIHIFPIRPCTLFRPGPYTTRAHQF